MGLAAGFIVAVLFLVVSAWLIYNATRYLDHSTSSQLLIPVEV